ncbi:MAG: histidine phosphatase family protein [Proteobacteria bacterium]|nr:histidine phosphatase family protein [Pseudomonadota bacterium]
MTAVDPRISRLGLDVLTKLAGSPPLQPRASRFLFLRHGATDGNVNKIYQRFDQPLNELGLGQARAAAAVLAARGGIARILASDMSRAWRTAGIAGEALGLAATVEVRLRERWYGDLVGTSSANLDWANDPPNGDTLRDFIARTREGLLAALDTEATTLIVAHGGTLYVLAAALGVGLEVDHMHNASPLAFERVGATWRIEALGPRAAGELLAPT